MFQKFLKNIGLNLDSTFELNNIVENAFNTKCPDLTDDQIESLYKYRVPKLGENGSCSITDQLEDEPYDIRSNKINISYPDIWRLNKVVTNLQDLTGVDWLGIYLVIDEKLVKFAYYGKPSRAEFPLTEDFAKNSNNSTVGLTGKAVLINDLHAHSGPYYICDAAVQSEFCCPILRGEDVIGIIDAESFVPEFFDDQKLSEIAKVCFDLGVTSKYLAT